ncbi:urease subunit beta [Halococcus sp. IIIV-5B]|uniref:urease subunit beta n=1 Tax=Halococcus sp. IIIV-5B TaxID=2321230 RepID=UPI000E73CB7D|nr:urease subunit beta [Halococcus sp. IIIV-5B]RJT07465.1 urease subunit beta [Halococcus sp. IIIV-5B]
MSTDLVPGEILPDEGSIALNPGRKTTTLRVANTGDRPVQIGSHLHFFEANAALEFDRRIAFGKRLAILAGTAVRFEPGDEKTVELVDFGGNRHIHGFNSLTDGDVNEAPDKALERARNAGFSDTGTDRDYDATTNNPETKNEDE